jgi:hypothetical protein
MNPLPYGLTLPGFIAYVQHRAWFASRAPVQNITAGRVTV